MTTFKPLGLLAVSVLTGLVCGGCSVGMALHGADNPDIGVLHSGQSRGVVEMELGKPKSFDIQERRAIYDYSTGEDGSAGRAIAHGAADFLTLGLWEVVGTPVEAVQTHTFWNLSVWYTEEDKVIRWSEPRRR